MIPYKPAPLLFVTCTPDGMVAHCVVEGQHHRIPLTTTHALALLTQLVSALEFHLKCAPTSPTTSPT